ncbi:hypothetical protein [Archangium sp.]|uniref:hypothetical protein n=1 Tax=Archangium sp. TaxID=1872627 RepID=UPI002D40B4D0|nr:hypothetical protein [Archangium sp.]HYO51847.1 hypothetical protein [Archangium sp.]
MRIMSLLVAVVAGLTFAAAGCGGVSESQQAPASESVLVEEQLSQGDSSEENVSAMAICPLLWTCNWMTYYSTQSRCTAACGGSPCYQDYACNRRCLCP